jgi:hypothetical protein
VSLLTRALSATLLRCDKVGRNPLASPVCVLAVPFQPQNVPEAAADLAHTKDNWWDLRMGRHNRSPCVAARSNQARSKFSEMRRVGVGVKSDGLRGSSEFKRIEQTAWSGAETETAGSRRCFHTSVRITSCGSVFPAMQTRIKDARTLSISPPSCNITLFLGWSR